jgi:hypothetical protein
METTGQRVRRFAVAVMLSCGAVVGATTSAGASPPSAIPPPARPHGASYAQWSARWWQWAFSTEATATGPFGEDAVDCGVNQPHQKVWFLAGPFNASGDVDRSCAVPAGTMLLIPVINVECSNLEAPPFFGATPAERAACVGADLFAFDDLEVAVDGKQIKALERFAVTSPDFAFTGVPDNPVGVVGNGFATSRGVFVMLTPLPRGTHTVTFTGSFPTIGFTASATYTIDVTHR